MTGSRIFGHYCHINYVPEVSRVYSVAERRRTATVSHRSYPGAIRDARSIGGSSRRVSSSKGEPSSSFFE